MQNERPFTASTPGTPAEPPIILTDSREGSGALEQDYANYTGAPSDETYVEHERRRFKTLLRGISIGVAVLLLGAAGIVLLRLDTGDPAASVSSGNFGVVSVPLSGITNPTRNDTSDTLRVDGTVQVAQSVVLSPVDKPSNPLAGQLYYDSDTNQLAYYNGQQFLNLGTGGSTTVNNINNTNVTNLTDNSSTTNITNILSGSGNGVELQPATPGTQQTGNFSVSGVGVVGTLQTAIITSGSGTISAQANGFVVQDASATHQNLLIDSNGAATFANKTDTTAGFQIQNAAAKDVFTVDTTNNVLVLGNDGNAANVSVTGIRGGAAVGNNITGKNLSISAGNGTGTGGSGDIIFNTATGVSNPLVTLDTTGGNQTNTAAVPLTWNHNTGIHPDPILIVAVNAQAGSNPATATSVTYNGVALTKLTDVSATVSAGSVWYMVNPPTGSHTVSVTYTGSAVGVGAQSTTFYNVDQADPIGGFNTQSINFGSSISTNLAGTNAGQAVFDALLSRQDLGIPTPGFGQTQLYTQLSDNVNTGSYKAGNGGSTTMSWSGSGVGSSLNHVVIALNPEPNVTPDPLTETLRITQSGTLGVSLAAGENAQATISLGGGADRSIVVNQNPDTGTGHKLTIQAGGGAIGNNNGGDLLLQSGAATGTGTAGSVIVRPPADSASAFQVQNAANTATVLSVDTTNKVVTVTNLAVTGHIITSGTTPNIAAGSAACTTPTVSVSGNDTSGIITVTTGTGCAANGTLATLTFASAYGAAPHVVIAPGSATSQGLGAYVDDATVGTTSFVLGTNGTPANTTTYRWNYMIMQ